MLRSPRFLSIVFAPPPNLGLCICFSYISLYVHIFQSIKRNISMGFSGQDLHKYNDHYFIDTQVCIPDFMN